MTTTIVKKRSPLIGLVAIVLVLDIIRLASCIIMVTQGQDYAIFLPLKILIGVYAVVVVACIVLLIRMNRSQLAFMNNSMIYTPLFGKKKEMSYSEIQKIYIGGKNYVLYNSEGKKFFTFDDFRTEKASQIVAFLKAKGVRTEM